MTSLLLVVAWCIIPLAASSYLVQTGLTPPGWDEPLRFISPVAVIGTAEVLGKTADSPETSAMVAMAFVQLGLAAALMGWVRRLCLTNADRNLGRI